MDDVRSAESRDAGFLAWAILAATRSHVARGWFDVLLARPESACLDFLRRLVLAETRSWWHYSRFYVAEVSKSFGWDEAEQKAMWARGSYIFTCEDWPVDWFNVRFSKVGAKGGRCNGGRCGRRETSCRFRGGHGRSRPLPVSEAVVTEDHTMTETTPSIAIRSVKDIPEALGASLRHGGLILTENDLCPEFFDLRTGLAGDVLQKFVNYRAKAAIVIADPRAHGERFSELAREHRTHGIVRFFTTEHEAKTWLRSPATS